MKEGQTQEPVGGMIWVKASDRLPDKEGDYFVIYITGEKQVLYASGNGHEKRWRALVKEWLDENYTPPPIKTEGERLSVKDVFTSDKDIINAGYITDELLPCPFCGNKTVLTYGNKNEKTGNITYFVTCNRMSGCGANIFTCLGGEETADKARQEMVDTWNNRKASAPPSPVGIDVDALAMGMYPLRKNADDFTYPGSALNSLQRIAFKAGYAASSQSSRIDKIVVSYPDHYKMVLTNSNGDTYTSNSIELKDFLHNYKQFEVVPQSSTEEEKELWNEVANVLYRFEMERMFDINELLSTYKISKR